MKLVNTCGIVALEHEIGILGVCIWTNWAYLGISRP